MEYECLDNIFTYFLLKEVKPTKSFLKAVNALLVFLRSKCARIQCIRLIIRVKDGFRVVRQQLYPFVSLKTLKTTKKLLRSSKQLC